MSKEMTPESKNKKPYVEFRKKTDATSQKHIQNNVSKPKQVQKNWNSKMDLFRSSCEYMLSLARACYVSSVSFRLQKPSRTMLSLKGLFAMLGEAFVEEADETETVAKRGPPVRTPCDKSRLGAKKVGQMVKQEMFFFNSESTTLFFGKLSRWFSWSSCSPPLFLMLSYLPFFSFSA